MMKTITPNGKKLKNTRYKQSDRIVTPGWDMQQAMWGDGYFFQQLCMTHYLEIYRKLNAKLPQFNSTSRLAAISMEKV